MNISKYLNYNLFQKDNLYKSSEDALYLTEYLVTYLKNIKKADNYYFLDIGSGNGVIDVLLYDSYLKNNCKNIKLYSVELQKKLYALSLKNYAKFNMQHIIKVINSDIIDFEKNNHLKFDLIFSNPPYFELCKNLVSPNESIAKAKFEITLTLFDLLNVAKKLLKDNGIFIFINREENSTRIINTANELKIPFTAIKKIHVKSKIKYIISEIRKK
jgi:tRNA1Val (adenine37-N6)-methyltransferase